MKNMRKIITGCLLICAAAVLIGVGILLFLFQGFLLFLYRVIFG